MKTLKTIIAVILIFIGGNSFAQSVAVGPINTYKIYAHSSTASKLVRMELVKLDKYNVLDQFDMYEVENPEAYDSCFAKQCLIEYGEKLNVDLVVSGSIDKIGSKIIITLKLIDIKTKNVIKTVSEQFLDQEAELQRMIGITVQKLHGIDPDPELMKSLSYKNEMITSTNVGQINNSGPRMGFAMAHGSLSEFLTRPEDQGGMNMQPMFSNIGYQFEVQYVGTENFSALFEFIPTFTGLEQGKFIPSIAVMNGFRFGQAGWEFAFGPSFGLARTSTGFFDHEGLYDPTRYGKYWTKDELGNAGFDNSASALEENNYFYKKTLDSRGDYKFSTKWIMAVGRTFKSGALNVPVNIFYSSIKKGGMLGLSVGFNITRKKKNIN